jgi:hypothetical protein
MIEALEETLATMPDVQRAIEANQGHSRTEASVREFNRTLIPLYLAMRAKGFGHYELVQ